MAVKGIAASAMAQGEVTQSTAIRTPIKSMPNEAGQVLRWLRHPVGRAGTPEARATIAAVNAVLAMKKAKTAATTPGTAVTSPKLADPRSHCPAKLETTHAIGTSP